MLKYIASDHVYTIYINNDGVLDVSPNIRYQLLDTCEKELILVDYKRFQSLILADLSCIGFNPSKVIKLKDSAVKYNLYGNFANYVVQFDSVRALTDSTVSCRLLVRTCVLNFSHNVFSIGADFYIVNRNSFSSRFDFNRDNVDIIRIYYGHKRKCFDYNYVKETVDFIEFNSCDCKKVLDLDVNDKQFLDIIYKNKNCRGRVEQILGKDKVNKLLLLGEG